MKDIPTQSILNGIATAKPSKYKYCPECGRNNYEEFKYCPECGEKLSSNGPISQNPWFPHTEKTITLGHHFYPSAALCSGNTLEQSCDERAYAKPMHYPAE